MLQSWLRAAYMAKLVRNYETQTLVDASCVELPTSPTVSASS